MPSSRLSLRLGQLPHDVLADLAARLCSDSPALQAIAEECMAAHKPLSHELVERVLLSPDLVPSILGPLETEDWAAAAVCSQWLAGWQATNEPRRRLKQVPLELPEEIDDTGELLVTGTPGGRLVVLGGDGVVRILDRSMRVLQTVAGEYYGAIAVSEASIYDVQFGEQGHIEEVLCRFSHAGTLEADYQLEGCAFACPLLAGGLLMCAAWNYNEEGNGEQDEIIALDAQTLQLRHRFGLGLLNNPQQMCVAAGELFVCDAYNARLQVFSLTGEHRRSITGEWTLPQHLCCVKDRLYLVEQYIDGDEAYESQGRRILVLSLQGDVLQVVTHPTEPAAFFTSVCCFDRKLLASFVTPRNRSAGIPTSKHGMLALRGL